MSWDALVKKTFRKKEEILPMQMAEVKCLPIDSEVFFSIELVFLQQSVRR